MSENNTQYTQYNYQTPPPPPPQSNVPPPPPPRPAPPAYGPRRTKSKFLTFVLGLIPGAGQMYHGLFKKGVSLMVLFWGTIAISSLTYIWVFNLLLPVIWFYSFFDAVNRMNMSVDEIRTIKDEYLFIGDSLTSPSETPMNRRVSGFIQKRHVLLGGGLIVLAFWILLNGLFGGYWYPNTIWSMLISEDAYYSIVSFVRMLPSLIVPVLCLILGIYLIAGSKNKDSVPPPRYDEYTIPQDRNTDKKE